MVQVVAVENISIRGKNCKLTIMKRGVIVAQNAKINFLQVDFKIDDQYRLLNGWERPQISIILKSFKNDFYGSTFDMNTVVKVEMLTGIVPSSIPNYWKLKRKLVALPAVRWSLNQLPLGYFTNKNSRIRFQSCINNASYCMNHPIWVIPMVHY